jgi:hypothetical protein
VVSIDKEKNILNGKVNFYMWGATLPITASITRIDKQLCPSKVERFENKDDKSECEKRLGHNMSAFIKSELGKPIRLRLQSKQDGILSGYYFNEFGKQVEIGGFKIPSDAKLKNVLTHSMHFVGKISDCDEIQPFKIVVSKVKNNDVSGASFAHKSDPNFVCKNHVVNSVVSNKIQQGTTTIVEKSKKKP